MDYCVDEKSQIQALDEDMAAIASDYAKTQPVVRQLIDLALLGSGLLKGKALSAFIKRSVELL